MHTNPIAKRLIPANYQRELTKTAALALVIGLVSIGLLVVLDFDVPLLPGVALFSVFLMPILTATLAHRLTYSETHTEAYNLVKLTDINARALVWGHTLAALFRLRWIWAILVGLSPLVMMGLIGASMRGSGVALLISHHERVSVALSDDLMAWIRDYYTGAALVFYAAALVMIAINVGAAAFGVGYALHGRGSVWMTFDTCWSGVFLCY